jgi:integrative and conjugative element protein (TIGR02256 family)
VVSERWESGDGRFAVQWREAPLRAIRRECLLDVSLETGGILIGRYNAALDTAIVEVASPPPPDSRRASASFYRGVKGIQEHLIRLWESDGGYYLGEWHFHPSAHNTTPSPRDLRQMSAIAVSDEWACPEPIMAIFASADEDEISAAMFLFPRGGHVARLEPAPRTLGEMHVTGHGVSLKGLAPGSANAQGPTRTSGDRTSRQSAPRGDSRR